MLIEENYTERKSAMSLPDYARKYQDEHQNDTDQQTLAEIKMILESDIKPLAMLAAIALIMHPRLAGNKTVDQHGPTMFEME